MDVGFHHVSVINIICGESDLLMIVSSFSLQEFKDVAFVYIHLSSELSKGVILVVAA